MKIRGRGLFTGLLVLIGLCASHSAPAKLNNGSFATGEGDDPTGLYSNILGFFKDTRLTTTPVPQAFKPAWPLLDSRPKLLTRFGTPTLLKNEGLSQEYERHRNICYFHEAIDVVRSSRQISEEVHAPVSGLAFLAYDGAPTRQSYSTAIAIYDFSSRYVVTLVHVIPDAKFTTPYRGILVSQGDVIGRLSPVASIISSLELDYRHTHVSVLDLREKRLVDPLPFFNAYKDSTAPRLSRTYLLDGNGNKTEKLSSGKFDIIAVAFDRDAYSEFNFEPSRLSYKITDQLGHKLKGARDCDLEWPAKNIKFDAATPTKFLDLQTMLGDTESWRWGGGVATNAANKDRVFNYALNRFSGDRCQLEGDERGELEVNDNIVELRVSLILEDAVGNKSGHRFKFVR